MTGARARLVSSSVIAIAIAACDGATSDPGTNAMLRVEKAQFVSGPMPAGTPSGPGVATITLPTTTLRPGFAANPLSGAIDPAATAVAIGLEGDVGYWIVPAGPPTIGAPNDASYSAQITLAPSVAPGTYTLVVRAVNAAQVFGLPDTQPVLAAGIAPPTGALVVTLTWDTESDLDLHVVDPMNDELFHGDTSSAPPPPFNDVDGGSYGYLDFDSNEGCVIDGLRREDVIWPDPPPSGTYVVRVDAASLCGQSIAHWTASAILNGGVIATASGAALDVDTRGAHDRGAGVLAFTFDVP